MTTPASTTTVRPLTLADLPGCLVLSQSANWNQNAADWTLMLRIGQGWGIDEADPASGQTLLAGSIVALPFDTGADHAGSDPQAAAGFAWLSMVLVLPAFGGRGYATRLLDTATTWLRARRYATVLDATPQGLPVYTKIGMQPHWMFRRYRRDVRPDGPRQPPRSRPLAEHDWAAVLAADLPAFGASREAILRDLAARQPQLARVLVGNDGLRGYVFGRDGREAIQIGPLWARDDEAAAALLADATSLVDGAAYLDLADQHDGQLPALAAAGFVEQRPFTRMTLDIAIPPGDPARLVLMAGPELG